MSEAPKAANAVSQSDIFQIFTVPAIGVDKFYASIGKNVTRITFAEAVPGTEEKIPRYSIVVTDNALAELSAMLAGILKAKANPASQPQVQEVKPDREELN